MLPRCLQESTRVLQEAPRALQERSKIAKITLSGPSWRPTRLPRRPKRTTRAPKRLPRDPKEVPKRPQEASKDPNRPADDYQVARHVQEIDSCTNIFACTRNRHMSKYVYMYQKQIHVKYLNIPLRPMASGRVDPEYQLS